MKIRSLFHRDSVTTHVGYLDATRLGSSRSEPSDFESSNFPRDQSRALRHSVTSLQSTCTNLKYLDWTLDVIFFTA